MTITEAASILENDIIEQQRYLNQYRHGGLETAKRKIIAEEMALHALLTQNEEPSEIVITAKAWEELPVDIKARMITNLKSGLTITGYAQS